MALTIVGASVNAIQVKYGLGQHELDVLTYSEELKWYVPQSSRGGRNANCVKKKPKKFRRIRENE